MKIKQLILSVILFLFAITVDAQEMLIIESSHLISKDTIYCFVPDNYSKEKAYPLVYLLHGYSTNSKQWTNTIDCNSMANKYEMIIVCPDGFTSFYVNSINNNQSQYENFFFEDLAPKIENEFNVDKKNIFISGLSMGGYGALHFFIKYSDFFNSAGSTSGALTIDDKQSRELSYSFWGNNRLNDDLKQIFGENTENWNKNDIINLLQAKPDFKRPFILDCGTEDILYSENIKLKKAAYSLGIPMTFISSPGRHNTKYWHNSIEHHFIFFKQHLR